MPMNPRTSNFDDLYAEYRPLVLRIAVRILGSADDAEDVAQEVFTKVWRGIKDFNHDASLKTWIYRIAVNTCLDHSRKPWKQLGAADARLDDVLWQIEGNGRLSVHDTAERKLLAREKSALLRKAVIMLKPHLKAVLVMKELEEMSYEEISARLGLSLGTISSRLNRARKALQETFENLRPALARG